MNHPYPDLQRALRQLDGAAPPPPPFPTPGQRARSRCPRRHGSRRQRSTRRRDRGWRHGTRGLASTASLDESVTTTSPPTTPSTRTTPDQTAAAATTTSAAPTSATPPTGSPDESQHPPDVKSLKISPNPSELRRRLDRPHRKRWSALACREERKFTVRLLADWRSSCRLADDGQQIGNQSSIGTGGGTGPALDEAGNRSFRFWLVPADVEVQFLTAAGQPACALEQLPVPQLGDADLWVCASTGDLFVGGHESLYTIDGTTYRQTQYPVANETLGACCASGIFNANRSGSLAIQPSASIGPLAPCLSSTSVTDTSIPTAAR